MKSSVQRSTERRVLDFFLPLLALGLLPWAAAAQDVAAAPALAWRCVQQTDAAFHVLCVPRMQVGASPHLDATPAMRPGVNVNMLPVAQRGDAEVMSADAWRIPLHVQPRDPQLVAQLLKSVLCGTRAACDVQYGAQGHEGAALLTARVN